MVVVSVVVSKKKKKMHYFWSDQCKYRQEKLSDYTGGIQSIKENTIVSEA